MEINKAITIIITLGIIYVIQQKPKKQSEKQMPNCLS